MDRFDLIVIGGGMGGYGAAIYAAKHNLKTLQIEKNKLGGTCLNRGCIPTKVYLESIHRFTELNDLSKFGINIKSDQIIEDLFEIDLEKLRARKERIVQALVSGVEKLLTSSGVTVIKGIAELNSDKVVTVDKSQEFTADNIIIATGSEPFELPQFKFDGKLILSSTDALDLEFIPAKLAVIGGGAIGCEFAEIYSGLGSDVTIFEMMPKILPILDTGIVKRFTPILKKKGIKILTGTKIDKVEKSTNTVLLKYGEESETFDSVLVSIGRRVNLDGVPDEVAKTGSGLIKVNGKMETNLPGIFAVGDVTGVQMLAHSAVAQGQVVIHNLINNSDLEFKPEHVPFVVYTSPEVAGVGYSEETARELFGDIKTGNFTFRSLGRAMAEEEVNGLVKVRGKDNKILGVHIFGKSAGELIHSAVPFIANNIQIDQVFKTVFAHPTLAESVNEAFEDFLGLAIHTISKRR